MEDTAAWRVESRAHSAAYIIPAWHHANLDLARAWRARFDWATLLGHENRQIDFDNTLDGSITPPSNSSTDSESVALSARESSDEGSDEAVVLSDDYNSGRESPVLLSEPNEDLVGVLLPLRDEDAADDDDDHNRNSDDNDSHSDGDSQHSDHSIGLIDEQRREIRLMDPPPFSSPPLDEAEEERLDMESVRRQLEQLQMSLASRGAHGANQGTDWLRHLGDIAAQASSPEDPSQPQPHTI